MKHISLIVVVVWSLLLPLRSVFAATVPAVQDTATTAASTVTVGTGKAPTLLVLPNRDALLRFNLADLPAGYDAATLQSARLKIYVARVIKAGDLALHVVTQDWSETANGPAPSLAALPVTTFASGTFRSKAFVVVDVTETVRAWLTDPSTNFGVALIAAGATPTARVTLAAKEGPGIGPVAELEVEASVPAGNGNASAVGTSIVSGGSNNIIVLGADFATIPGGDSNAIGALGDFSLAAGRRAKVNHQGSFVWADSTNADFSSTANNQFRIRAANGLSLANDGGGSNTYPIGTYFRDNSIFAWGRVTLNGALDSNFNVASVTHVSAGVYTITLNSPASSGFSLITSAVAEVDSTVSLPAAPVPPVGAANVRITVVDKIASGASFNVYIYNGSFALVDNDFEFVVTGR